MCEDREQLIAYLYDEVDANERRSVEAHLTGCDECRDELRGLRGVRQDLLAWDVPPHESVWTPFVTARPQPVWRQVPTWALAAAATLVFATGVAGGVAGRLWVGRADAAPQAAALQMPASTTQSPAAPVAISVSPESIRALEARVNDLERVSSRPNGTASPVSLASHSDAELLAQMEQLIRDSEGRMSKRTSQKLLSMFSEINSQRAVDLANVQLQINDAQERTNGSILAVKNMRTEKERE
jgi:hypothetical protein